MIVKALLVNDCATNENLLIVEQPAGTFIPIPISIPREDDVIHVNDRNYRVAQVTWDYGLRAVIVEAEAF